MTDQAPSFPPRTIVISWEEGEPLTVEPGEGTFADWEVEAALTEALKVWQGVDEDADQS
jgi:hypothetical protein